MRATVRVPLVVFALLTATTVRAQTPIARNLPAQDLLARTKAGQEDQVACNELDAGVAEVLVDLGQQSRTESLERLTVVYRLAERAALRTSVLLGRLHPRRRLGLTYAISG